MCGRRRLARGGLGLIAPSRGYFTGRACKKNSLPLLVVVWLSFVLLVVDYLPGI